jgi:hypothetical protein
MASFPSPKCLLKILVGTQDFIKPAMSKPNNNQGLASALKAKKFVSNVDKYSKTFTLLFM